MTDLDEIVEAAEHAQGIWTALVQAVSELHPSWTERQWQDEAGRRWIAARAGRPLEPPVPSPGTGGSSRNL